MRASSISSVDGIDLSYLAERYGSPLYVYSADSITAQFNKLKNALKSFDPTFCYAVKANSNLALLQHLEELGSDFDVVSEGELRRLLKIGVDSARIIFEGVGKSFAELEFAVHAGLRSISVESVQELRLIAEIASTASRPVPVALRINPDVALDTHRHLSTGKKSDKFGIDSSQLSELLPLLKSLANIEIRGMHVHIGSGGSDVNAFLAASALMIDQADMLRHQGHAIKDLDFGGGFRVSYAHSSSEFDFASYASGLSKLLSGKDYNCIFEPGKFLITQAGNLLCRVLYTKRTRGEDFVIVDAGLNDLIRPALYEAQHQIDIVLNEQAAQGRELQRVHVGGPVCESACIFARDLETPAPQPGDLLILRDAGAYGFSMSSNYNTRPRPAEVLIKHGEVFLIRRRESYEDLWRNEIVLDQASPPDRYS